ncbi:MAG: hypothetical protein V3T16_05240 [Gemmatimonadales bacterium]
MDWRIVLGLIGLGVVIGFVVRSSLGFLFKVGIVVAALAAFHVISPDGIPDLVRQGFEWIYEKVSSEAKDVLPDR